MTNTPDPGRKALGRGLSSLIPTKEASATQPPTQAGALTLPIEVIQPNPTQPRTVFDADERRVFRHLVLTFPHHTVLAKLPLVRFCQPQDPASVRRWYRLLSSQAVTFAVCSPSGRVMVAIDLERRPGGSERSLRIKQEVLAACRVRYLRCPADRLPTAAELHLLVPHSAAGMRGPQPAPVGRPEEGALEEAAAPGVEPGSAGGAGEAVFPRGRQALWRDPGYRDSYHGRLGTSAAAPSSILPDFEPDHPGQPGLGGPESVIDLSQDLSEALGDGASLPPMSARH